MRDAIETVLALLPERGAVHFRELTYGVSEKLEIIVRFLAVLELFKQGVVDLEQVESFGELMVRPLRRRRTRRARPLVARGMGRRAVPGRPDPHARPAIEERGRGAGVSDHDTSVDVETRRAIEAIVLAATEPVHPTVMAQLLELSVEAIDELCAQLAAEYEAQGRGFQLARVAGGYRFQTHPDAYAYVERFVLDGQTARLSGPALETLAIIAYKQPVSRAQLSAIRGVNVEATLKTLVARGYVDEIGHDPSPGNPSMFATSRLFLERLGLNSLSDLPALADFVPESSIVEALERGLLLTSVEDNGSELARRLRGRSSTTPASCSSVTRRGRAAAEGARARRASGRVVRTRC